MNNNNKASVSIIKIILITILFFCICSVGVKAFGLEVNNVEIVFPDNTEINVFTNKTLVSEILEENHVVILDDESVVPSLNSEILSDNKIVITKGQEDVKAIKLTQGKTDVSMSDLLSTYVDITEKIVTEDIEIPYETITKDVSEGDSSTTTNVLQQGVNGIKRITAKVKYQNGVEIDRNILSEQVISEPINKIVQINKVVTTRSLSVPRATGSVAEYQAYAKQKCNSYGWSDEDFKCLVKLWDKESGWNPYAQNPKSTAYGIPQAMLSVHRNTINNNYSDYKTNYKTQIDWGMNYIKQKYGSPSKVWGTYKNSY